MTSDLALTHTQGAPDLRSKSCPPASTVLSGLCGGRTYTFKKGALQTAQIAMISTLAYLALDSMINPSTNSKIAVDFSIVGVIFLIAVSSAREIFHCSRQFRDDKKGILNPFNLATIALFAASLAVQVSYTTANGVVNKRQEDVAAFNQSLIKCNNFMIQNAEALTADPCVPCQYVEEGYFGPLNKTVMQQVIKDFQQIVCLTPENSAYWDDLITINANQTSGTYPCSPEFFNPENQSMVNSTVLAYFQLLQTTPPMVFDAALINATCKKIFGFGTQAFFLSELCGSIFDDPSSIGEYDYAMLECMTPELQEYMEKYVDEIGKFIQSSSELTHAIDVLDEVPLKTFWTTTAISAAVAIAYKFFVYKRQQREGGEPLLN